MNQTAVVKVRIPRELKKLLEKAAEIENRSVSNLASIFLEKGVDRLFSGKGCNTPNEGAAK